MPIRSENITITVDGTDYSIHINEYDESGGDNNYVTKKCLGNVYRKAYVGKSSYEVKLHFKMEGDELSTLFNKTDVINITINMINDDASTTTVSYSNMLPDTYNIEMEVEDIVYATLTYSCPGLNSTGTDNRVIS